jgi:hypothetical protein
VFHKKAVEKIKTHILFSITFFFFENHAGYELNVEKYCTAGQATGDNMAHAYYVGDSISKLKIQVTT